MSEIDNSEAAFTDETYDLELVEARAGGKRVFAERRTRRRMKRSSRYGPIIIWRRAHANYPSVSCMRSAKYSGGGRPEKQRRRAVPTLSDHHSDLPQQRIAFPGA